MLTNLSPKSIELEVLVKRMLKVKKERRISHSIKVKVPKDKNLNPRAQTWPSPGR